MFYVKDDRGNKSETSTYVWAGLLTACAKLLLSGIKVHGLEMGNFSGSEAAVFVAPFLALLAHKRQVRAKLVKPSEQAAKPTNVPEGD
jgi:hypothetical protein